MTFDEWFESRYPRRTYSYADAEIANMRDEYREVWDAGSASNARDAERWRKLKSFAKPAYVAHAVAVDSRATGSDKMVYAASWEEFETILDGMAAYDKLEQQ